tara:strand:- start:941 stop:1273 length:333 start_codon:yes stop_codon:yes gene_type:complete
MGAYWSYPLEINPSQEELRRRHEMLKQIRAIESHPLKLSLFSGSVGRCGFPLGTVIRTLEEPINLRGDHLLPPVPGKPFPLFITTARARKKKKKKKSLLGIDDDTVYIIP